MATLFHVLQFLDNSGNPLSGGKVYWEQAGISTPLATWQDQAESIPNGYPITLDVAGRPPGGGIFIRGSYKLIVKDSTLATTFLTIDNINEYNQYNFTGLTVSIADLNSTTTNVINVNSVTTITLSNRGKTLLCDATSASFNVNLLPASTALNTYEIVIKKIDVSVNPIVIIPNGSEKIDTDIDFTLYDFNDFVKLHGDGSNWKVISSQIRGTIVTQATAATLTLKDNGKMFNFNAASAGFSINLPDARVVGRGYKLSFKKTDVTTNIVTILPNGTQTIDGSNLATLSAYNEAKIFKTDGLNWFIVSDSRSSADMQTGDVKASYNSNQPGWVQMNDGSVGNASSMGTTRANADTQALFILLWNAISNTYCPVKQGGSLVPRGVSALIDFNANRTIDVPKALGRSLIQAGSAGLGDLYALGQTYGEWKHTPILAEMFSHAHDTSLINYTLISGPADSGYMYDGYEHTETKTYTSTSKGSSTPFNVVHPVTALYFFIKL